MKRFILKILIFAFLVILLDIAIGIVANYLIDNALSGETQKNKYIADYTSEDILIFGSSRGAHHYDPRIIEDSLGMSCYNCSYEGCGSITAYGLLKIVTDRYIPKIIVYELTPKYDYLVSDEDNTKYLGPLKYFYDREGIDSIFIKVKPEEQLKMQSHLYRINSRVIQLVSENIIKRNENIKGYLPRDKRMKHEPVIDETHSELSYDPLKTECLKRIITICKEKNIKLILCVSPSYKKIDDYEFEFAKQLAEESDISFINHYCDSALNKNKEYFFDSLHMNVLGAETYSKIIVQEIKELLNAN